MLAIKEREIGIEETNRIKIDFYRKYNRNSAWAKSQNNEVKEQADSVASKQLYEGAIGFHQYALQKMTAVFIPRHWKHIVNSFQPTRNLTGK